MTPGTLPTEMRACADYDEAASLFDAVRVARTATQPMTPDEVNAALAVLRDMQRRGAK